MLSTLLQCCIVIGMQIKLTFVVVVVVVDVAVVVVVNPDPQERCVATKGATV